MVESKIESLLEVKFQEEEFTDCFLIEVKLHANKKLDVFIDSDAGVTFEKCQKISRYLEQYLDEEGWLGDSYVLEVSSPGISRPLKLLRQYPRNIGRKVEVRFLSWPFWAAFIESAICSRNMTVCPSGALSETA